MARLFAELLIHYLFLAPSWRVTLSPILSEPDQISQPFERLILIFVGYDVPGKAA